MKDICVIIVTFNGMKWLKDCIESVSHELNLHDIIVVDNGSKDGTIEFIQTEYPEIQLFINKENLGFGKANNIGIELGYRHGYQYFFLLNQDAYVEKNTIGQLVSTMSINDDIGILSPIHLTGDGKELDQGFMSGIKSKNFVKDYQNQKWSKDLYQVKFVNAAAWMISRHCLEKIGIFHPLFFHYGEDKNYVKRVRYHKLKIMIDRKAFIKHDRENRISNTLKEDPFRNMDRVFRQIILNPYNPKFIIILVSIAMIKLFAITKGWQFSKKQKFIHEGIYYFFNVLREVKKFNETYDSIKKVNN